MEDARLKIFKDFKKNIAPLIKSGKCLPSISKTTEKIFGEKYITVVKKYGDTIRISVRNPGLGIIYFLAETSEGSDDYQFIEPSYQWRSIT